MKKRLFVAGMGLFVGLALLASASFSQGAAIAGSSTTGAATLSRLDELSGSESETTASSTNRYGPIAGHGA